jgi:hypothetical protein
MKNITITLDPETAAWVRVQAAEQNLSVSRFIGSCSETDDAADRISARDGAVPVQATNQAPRFWRAFPKARGAV